MGEYVVRQRVGQVVLGAIVTAVVVGPPAWIIYRIAAGGPLLATRTVTKTSVEYHGILPDVASVFIVWAVILVFGWGVATGALPRGQY